MLQHTATHCNTLQHAATELRATPAIGATRTATHTATHIAKHCNTLQHNTTYPAIDLRATVAHAHCNTHCNTLQHTATHCNTQQQTATHCNTLQHTATHCNTLTQQHTATHFNPLHLTLQQNCDRPSPLEHSDLGAVQVAARCNALQRTATHRNTLQHTSTHCNRTASNFYHWSTLI